MRLIDADALLDKFEWKEDGPLYIRALRTMIEAAPTIYAVQHTDDVIQRMQDIKQAQIEKAYDLGYAEGEADAEPQWIPCSERLPETEDVYLVTVHPDYVPQGCKQVDLMYYFEGEWQFFNEKAEWEKWPDPIIAWMPLPEPYKVKTEE